MTSVAALFAVSPIAVLRGQSRPFIAGFVAAGWAAVIVYVATCALIPDLMALPVLHYINEIEPRFMDADTLAIYSVSLIVRGAVMAAPQLLIALAGGCLAKLNAQSRLSKGTIGGPTRDAV
jgi:hypothetical protein